MILAMAIRAADITPEQGERILALDEGHFQDLKALEVNQATQTRSWRGFSDEEAANGHLQAFEGLFPLGGDFEYEFLRAEAEPTLVLHATIRKTKDIKSASDGTPYLRRGAQNLPVSTKEELR